MDSKIPQLLTEPRPPHELKSTPIAKKGKRTFYRCSCSCGRWAVDRTHLGAGIMAHAQHVRQEEGLPTVTP